MKPAERLMLALILAPCAVVVWLYFGAVSDCEKAGGKAVKGAAGWVECVKA